MAKSGDALCPQGDGNKGRGSLRHLYSPGLQAGRGSYRYQPVLADENQEIAD